jgi:hypothetical protein
MTAAAQVLSVTEAEDDQTACRRCARPIRRGQRIVLVLGTGNVHLRCLISHQADDTDLEDQP